MQFTNRPIEHYRVLRKKHADINHEFVATNDVSIFCSFETAGLKEDLDNSHETSYMSSHVGIVELP